MFWHRVHRIKGHLKLSRVQIVHWCKPTTTKTSMCFCLSVLVFCSTSSVYVPNKQDPRIVTLCLIAPQAMLADLKVNVIVQDIPVLSNTHVSHLFFFFLATNWQWTGLVSCDIILQFKTGVVCVPLPLGHSVPFHSHWGNKYCKYKAHVQQDFDSSIGISTHSRCLFSDFQLEQKQVKTL